MSCPFPSSPTRLRSTAVRDRWSSGGPAEEKSCDRWPPLAFGVRAFCHPLRRFLRWSSAAPAVAQPVGDPARERPGTGLRSREVGSQQCSRREPILAAFAVHGRFNVPCVSHQLRSLDYPAKPLFKVDRKVVV